MGRLPRLLPRDAERVYHVAALNQPLVISRPIFSFEFIFGLMSREIPFPVPFHFQIWPFGCFICSGEHADIGFRLSSSCYTFISRSCPPCLASSPFLLFIQTFPFLSTSRTAFFILFLFLVSSFRLFPVESVVSCFPHRHLSFLHCCISFVYETRSLYFPPHFITHFHYLCRSNSFTSFYTRFS